MVIAAVGIAGMLGALLRYWIGTWIGHGGTEAFPLGTLLINMFGCGVLGWFTAWGASKLSMPAWLRAGFGTGLVGSFTTFSTFSVDALTLLQDARTGEAVAYMLLSLWGGLLFAWIGIRLGRYTVGGRSDLSKRRRIG